MGHVVKFHRLVAFAAICFLISTGCLTVRLQASSNRTVLELQKKN